MNVQRGEAQASAAQPDDEVWKDRAERVAANTVGIEGDGRLRDAMDETARLLVVEMNGPYRVAAAICRAAGRFPAAARSFDALATD